MAKMKIFVGSRRDVPPERLYKVQELQTKEIKDPDLVSALSQCLLDQILHFQSWSLGHNLFDMIS